VCRFRQGACSNSSFERTSTRVKASPDSRRAFSVLAWTAGSESEAPLAVSDVDIGLTVATRIDDGCLALIAEDVGEMTKALRTHRF
jgi:hypothetical protein